MFQECFDGVRREVCRGHDDEVVVCSGSVGRRSTVHKAGRNLAADLPSDVGQYPPTGMDRMREEVETMSVWLLWTLHGECYLRHNSLVGKSVTRRQVACIGPRRP